MRMKKDIKGNRRGQIALEYALTTTILAAAATFIYVLYQPIVITTFFPLDQVDQSTGQVIDKKGLGARDILFLPFP